MMTILAYVLIQVKAGFTLTIAEKIRKLDQIKMAHAVTGPVDIIAIVEMDDLNQLGDVIESIHRVEGVVRTQTCVVIG